MVHCTVSLQGQESDLVEEVTFELSRALKINKAGQGNEGREQEIALYKHNNMIAQKAYASGEGSCGFH